MPLSEREARARANAAALAVVHDPLVAVHWGTSEPRGADLVGRIAHHIYDMMTIPTVRLADCSPADPCGQSYCASCEVARREREGRL